MLKHKLARRDDSRDDSRGDKIAATVVIKDGALMHAKGKKQIAAWLRRTATFLEKHNDEMAPRFTARWWYD